MKVLFIDCSEKQHTQIDSIISYFNGYFNSLNIQTSKIALGNLKITKCSQCRCCTIKKSSKPVNCVFNDDMPKIIEEIEKADAYIILADRTSLFNRNKILKKFSQRLVAFYYWPYNKTEASLRDKLSNKKSILINFNTTKYFMNHSFYTTKVYMEEVSKSIGAQVQGWIALTPKNDLINSYKDIFLQMSYRLIATSSFNKRVAS